MNMLLTETFNCENCSGIIEIPMYCNFGRYVPTIVWCNNEKCRQEYKYWRFFGCFSEQDIYLWKPYKGRPILVKN